MILTDLHVHSNFCDGKNSPEELVLAAIKLGVKRLGILAHSYVVGDEDGTLLPDREQEFMSTINALKEKYADKIELLCGLEQDMYAAPPNKGYDYIIGSVHYFCVEGKLMPLDYSEDTFRVSVNELFGGDYLAAAEAYFAEVARVIEVTGADVIGHLDLITKFNGNGKYFDTSDPRYVCAYKRAVDKLVLFGKSFEVNTGGIYRGYKDQPYPSLEIIKYIKSVGGKLILSSDAHRKDALCFEFDKWCLQGVLK